MIRLFKSRYSFHESDFDLEETIQRLQQHFRKIRTDPVINFSFNEDTIKAVAHEGGIQNNSFFTCTYEGKIRQQAGKTVISTRYGISPMLEKFFYCLVVIMILVVFSCSPQHRVWAAVFAFVATLAMFLMQRLRYHMGNIMREDIEKAIETAIRKPHSRTKE